MSEPKEPDLPPQGPLPLRISGGDADDYILPIRLEQFDGGWKLVEFWEWRGGLWQRQTCSSFIARKEDFQS